MSRHIQFESVIGMTGANADERYHITSHPKQGGKVVLALCCFGRCSAALSF